MNGNQSMGFEPGDGGEGRRAVPAAATGGPAWDGYRGEPAGRGRGRIGFRWFGECGPAGGARTEGGNPLKP